MEIKLELNKRDKEREFVFSFNYSKKTFKHKTSFGKV